MLELLVPLKCREFGPKNPFTFGSPNPEDKTTTNKARNSYSVLLHKT